MADVSGISGAAGVELEALWDEFHQVVNMTSQELGAWLRTESAGEETEELPEESGTEQGRHVLKILQKRRTDLTDADIRLMAQVVDTVQTQHEHAPAPDAAEHAAWRHRLMTLGHDPLRAG
ncbi:DUF3140 domain-containing protein [Streptomyces gobiensis]|uniref:DUF3140 domain-containing protein n=1 Tax=Streptomyces gobiensis TaxID=2875706 RepID=UPI00241191EC|nr:DUF3140 domain-containing protein [Streptomyces gobiensis]UGY94540.1 DUF3140 domain-containing protein [Streptomyces gobiensis]